MHGPLALLPVPRRASNNTLSLLGAWDHAYRLAYNRLTSLNQDVTYRWPSSVLPAVAVHLLAGAPGFLSDSS